MTPNEIPSIEAGRDKSRSTVPDAPVGRVLYERFLIEQDRSGPGDSCSTYLAKDLRNFCTKVIVRVIPLTEHTRRSNAFQEICETLMQLDHPKVECILETGRLFDARPYAVTTYDSGRSLGQILHGDRRLILDRVAQTVESVGDALGAAHSLKILHGDVTPANIFISPPHGEVESIRLVSFGAAWPADPGLERFANTRLESLFYTAPELMSEDGRATPASDIYSLAVVAYRMLTGEEPFRAADREKMLELIAQGVQARPSNLRTDLSPDAEAMILSALQYKAAMRPRDARTFGRDLANELRGGVHRHKAPGHVKAAVPVPVLAKTTVEIALQTEADERRVERKRMVAQKGPSTVSDWTITWSLIALLIAGALSIPIFQTLFSDEQQAAAINSIVNKPAGSRLPRELRYTIEGQNLRNAALMASQPELQSSFSEAGGYKITFETESAGNAYVFSEAADENGRKVYSVLYPLAKVNGGSAHIEPKHQAATRPVGYNGSRSPEIVWLVWTAGRQDDLESARRTALETDGVVRNENDVQKLRHFLERNKNFKLDIRKDDANQQTVLNGAGDKIVHRVELEHK